MKRYLYTLGFFLASSAVHAQLYVESGATLYLETGSVVTVQGNLTSSSDIQGPGKILMKGAALQNLNMNGKIIPNLEVDNTNNILLTGACKVNNTLTFTNGKLQLGNNNFTLASVVTVTGAGTGKFVETTGSGKLLKEITATGSYVLPVGAGANYTPLQYTLSGSPALTNASLGVVAVNAAHPNKPIRAEDYLKSYWKASFTGITGGTLNAVGTYADAGSITGSETYLNAIRYNGTDWNLANSTIDKAANTATYNTVANGADLYVMDKFVLVKAKAFLQGAYNSGTGMMNDALRTKNLLPLSDPYRTATYTGTFPHTNNSTPETISSSVLTTNPTDANNIVDWVFLELRTTATPGSVFATRSALIQKDGDIVDVDGINPVFFKNIDAGNYTIVVRHRNHLGIAADGTTFAKTLSVANPSSLNTFDFANADDSKIYGPATAFITINSKIALWAGDANFNKTSKYTGPGNDKDYILGTILGGVSTVPFNGYSQGDLNMDGIVKYAGPSNDKDYLLSAVLGGVSTVPRTASLP